MSAPEALYCHTARVIGRLEKPPRAKPYPESGRRLCSLTLQPLTVDRNGEEVPPPLEKYLFVNSTDPDLCDIMAALAEGDIVAIEGTHTPQMIKGLRQFVLIARTVKPLKSDDAVAAIAAAWVGRTRDNG